MAPIAHPMLQPRVDLGPEDLEALAVTGFGPTCTPTLIKTGWKQFVTANIGVAMSANNNRILSANIFLLGKLHKSATECTAVSAARFWPNVDPKIELRFPFDKMHIFPFDASLQSGLVDSSAVEFEIYNTGTDLPMSPEDFKAAGGSSFTLRAFAHMTTAIWLKLQLVLYPLGKEALLDTFPFAHNVNFPGLLLVSKNVTMLPNSTKDYGLPFAPFLLKGNPDAPFPQAPSYELRAAISALLQTGVTPKLSKDATYLAAKWTKMKDLKEKAEDSLTSSSTSAATWPDALPSPSPSEDAEDSELEGM